MVTDLSFSRKLFVLSNYIGLSLLALLCLFPLIHTLAVSLSSRSAAEAGLVSLWPIDFNISSYQYALSKQEFIHAFFVSVQRVALGLTINMLMIILTAYPLAKEVNAFRLRTVYVWFFFFTVLFGGGLVPSYMIMQHTGLLDTIWALIIPGAVPVFSVVLLLNFFRGLPKEIEESALIDGAGHLTVLWRIYVPLSVPALATLALFSIVGHWNSWFDGIIYMRTAAMYPLQSYLQTIVIDNKLLELTGGEGDLYREISGRAFTNAQIFLGALPVLIVYPFLQKYFVKGIVVGSVKG
ncbi:carbohydrate ABC transporter permease [Paenibacillus eucommiae]|uniref:Aldouronate transport system permease protein n=1 Tax=Paenibacillus eucommiae TaxID=1355755 RepID=A0ABS4J367_9BACL|nr:carbohydrate ABC transporter permease [Paenibacillus eucommiae]MBP1994280.1 putative aldouronate transport system permease protein [Paenibacillus eucommiae]